MRNVVRNSVLGLGFALMAKDILFNYWIEKNVNDYLLAHPDQAAARQVSLTYRPWTGVKVHIDGARLKRDNVDVYIEELALRVPLLSLREVSVIGQSLILGTALQSQRFTGLLKIEKDRFLLSSGNFTEIGAQINQVNFAAPAIQVAGGYIKSTQGLTLDVSIPDLMVNQAKGAGLISSAKLTLTKPMIGFVDLHVRGIKDLLQGLSASGLIKDKNLPFVLLGAQLFGTQDQEIPLSLQFTADGVFLGPIKIAPPL